MAIPEFTENGDLPQGVYHATLAEVLERFGHGTLQRRAVADRLNRVYELAASTGHLRHFVIFGSFVTAKDDPNDVDIVLIMQDTFDLAATPAAAAILFHHLEAASHFGASIFWTRVSAALGGEQAMIEYWQIRRDGGKRGIVEIL